MTENTREVENILILGNGFDLAMGRSTRYTDFLEFLDTIRFFMEYEFKEEDFTNDQYSEFLGIEAEIDEKSKQEFIKHLNEFWDDIKTEESYIKSYYWLESIFKNHGLQRDGYDRKSEAVKYISSILEYIHDILDESIVNRIYNAVYEFDEIVNEDYSGIFYDDVLDYLDVYLKEASLSDKILFLYDVIPEIHDLEEFEKKVLDFKYVSFEFDLEEILSLVYEEKELKELKDTVAPYRFWSFFFVFDANMIYSFIHKNKKELGNNWSNLEIMISDLANALNDIKQNIKDYKVYLEQETEVSVEQFSHQSNPMAYAYMINEIKKTDGSSKPLLSIIDEVNDKLYKDLEQLTDWLEFYFIYLDKIENIQKNENTVISDLENRSNSKVINFNYTDTIRKFGVTEENIHFIHGRLNFDRSRFPINQMVFGIEDKKSEVEDINTDLIPYQKFYQRIVKETGNDYQEFFKSDNDKIILVFGHSVDPLDKEIFQNCFRLLGYYQEKNEKMIEEKDKVNYRFIFAYYDEDAKQSIVKNLAIILGKQRLVTLTGQKKIQFVKNDDREKMRSILKEWEESRQLTQQSKR